MRYELEAEAMNPEVDEMIPDPAGPLARLHDHGLTTSMISQRCIEAWILAATTVSAVGIIAQELLPTMPHRKAAGLSHEQGAS